MRNVTIPRAEEVGAAQLSRVAFTEICERLIRARSLVDDPHHQSRKQGSAMARVLHEGLHAVERQLDSLRRLTFGDDSGDAGSVLAGLGIAAAGLTQVQAHLHYLGGRLPLGTADLFVRKLVAEGMPIPIPTLCPVDVRHPSAGDVGSEFRERLSAAGLTAHAPERDAPVLTIPTIDVLDPLAWPALLYPLASVVVSRRRIASRLREPSSLDHDKVRRLCVAGVAARFVGEPTYAACAVQALVDRLVDGASGLDLDVLAQATDRYVVPVAGGDDRTPTDFYRSLLQEQRSGGTRLSARQPSLNSLDGAHETALLDDYFLSADIPLPDLPTEEDIGELVRLLADGRPINALAPELPADFAERLDAGIDAPRFYAVLGDAGERPCSLAAILAGGLRYKLRHSLPLCGALMASAASWSNALTPYAAHVHERSALLLQSIEAAYVQQMFSARRDE